MEKVRSRILPYVRRHWSLWAAVALALVPVVRLAVYPAKPCRMPSPYYHSSISYPVDYAVLIAEHTYHDCGFIWEVICGVPVLAALLLVFAKDRRNIIRAAAVVACISACGLSMLVLIPGVGGDTLADKGSADFNSRRYHLTEAYYASIDINYTEVILYECDLDDTNCSGVMLNEYGSPAYADPSLVQNEDADQLEVWADGRMVHVLSNPHTTPMPADYADLPVIDPENAGSLGELVTLTNDSLRALLWSPDGDALVGVSDSRIWLYSLSNEAIATELLDSDSISRWMEGAVLIPSPQPFTLPADMESVWGLSVFEFEPVGTVVGYSDNAAISSDGHIFTLHYDNGLYANGLYDAVRGKTVWEISGTGGFFGDFAFNASNTLLAFTGDEYDDDTDEYVRYLRIWDIETESEVSHFDGHGVGKLAFTPDDTLLFYEIELPRDPDDCSCGTSTYLYTWDLEKQAMAYQLQLPDEAGGIYSLAISPDSRLVAAATGDGVVRLWAVDSGELVGEVKAHQAVNTLHSYSDFVSAAFSPDGRILATSGIDHRVILWGVVR